jgi:HdeA/HdeB family
MWLSGYFHGKRGDTMIDTQKLIADADAVENYCFKTQKRLSCLPLKRSSADRNGARL